jgi:exodeoxyribonuclease V gamma subunit
VLSLLALPAVSRRFSIDESRREALERWLARCHVAWGIDGKMKADFGAAPVDEHSFAFGFDRMYAGLMLGETGPDELLEDILPATPVTGPSGAALGALWKLIELLREWRSDLSRPRPLAEWSGQLGERFKALFAVDRKDADERAAMTALDRLVASLAGSQAEAAASNERRVGRSSAKCWRRRSTASRSANPSSPAASPSAAWCRSARSPSGWSRCWA